MPAILNRGDEAAWLDPQTRPEKLRALLLPYPSEFLDVRRVGARIGDVSIDEPSLLDESSAAQGDLFGAV
jgi:putative SOS response-associated peptidase YedK